MDIFSLLGLMIGIGAIIIGNFLEGGEIVSLLNAPAIVIVFGGTFGAIVLQYPAKVILRATKILAWVLFPKQIDLTAEIEKIIQWSSLARKEGLLGLEVVADSEEDSFAKKGLQLLVDGNEPEVIRDCLDVELDTREFADFEASRVFESMGGFSPTIGIIGAVMGLIHVMKNLADPNMLGSGIATAFVATIYGVGLANLLFLPIAAKLKANAYELSKAREMMSVGIVSIAEGENPRNIELKLSGFLQATN